jgi:hypothetical protein
MGRVESCRSRDATSPTVIAATPAIAIPFLFTVTYTFTPDAKLEANCEDDISRRSLYSGS